MGELKSFGPAEPRFTLIEIEELAAQAWAVIDAKFRRPNRSEKEQILAAMKSQLPNEAQP